MGFLSLTSWPFAAAGAICACAPLVIHLLNRRRYRVVKWAAMDFLHQALQRNRRILQLRDILLLILRTAAVLLFGLALARPYFAARSSSFDERQPVHAVILIDNSLSMAYESLEGSLLDMARDRARQLIEKLPAGSRISIIPVCGSREGYTPDPYETKERASEALGRIAIVDRSASLLSAANEARRASETFPELTKRIVFIGDHQQCNWRDARRPDLLKALPSMQIVNVSPPDWENTWIADLRLQDGLADVETPATVIVELRHHGPAPRRDLQVRLAIGDTVIGEKTVTIEPGLGTRQVEFQCVFGALAALPEPDKPLFVTLRASIAPDRLAADDERFLAVPVVAALPVVFVDQYGPQQEDPIRGRLGETRHLRKLLAPRTSRSEATRQLVNVRHLTLSDLTQAALADARLVVAAGLREPGGAVQLLAEYVHQGGQLLLAAGADFDPAAWDDAAWLDGDGLLPLPLEPEPIGEIPEVGGDKLRPFSLSFDSLAGEDYFHLAGVAESELRDLYAEPFFFKAVQVDASPAALAAVKQAIVKRGAAESADAITKKPAWLTWAAETGETAPESVELRLLVGAPHVLARFDLAGGAPFLVSRKMGRGTVVFCATGLLSSWNTLPKTNAVLVFDRLLRGMTQNTLPQRNFPATDRLTLPLPAHDQNLLVTLARPGDNQGEELLDVGYIGSEQRGVTLTALFQRGAYRVSGFRPPAVQSPTITPSKPTWEVPLVIGGAPDESDLSPLTRDQLDEIAADTNLNWVGPGEEIRLAGAAIYGQHSWWWLVLTVFVLLLLEMSVLAWPTLRPSPSPLAVP